MSLVKIRGNCFKINLGDARNKTCKRKAVLISDSKGKYIQQEISTEKFLDLTIISHPGLQIDNTNFIWSTLKRTIKKKEKAIVFLWIGTCNLTTKTDKYIQLTNDTPKYHSKIDDIANRLSDWKAQIQARYKHTRVIILECPPYSIVAYNKANGHPNPAEGSLEQTARLEQQIYYLNALIRNINNKNLKVTTKQSKVDLNNNLTESDKAGKTKPNRYTSPNFSSDVLRQTKYQRQQTKYYVDYKVYTDGIHPGPTLAKLWLRRICQRIIQLCY